jgi:LPXTG-motif cell wall-anchored protein
MSWTAQPVTQPRANVVATRKAGTLPATGVDMTEVLVWAAGSMALGLLLFKLRRPVRVQPARNVPMARLPEE